MQRYSDGAASATMPETFVEAIICVHFSTDQSGRALLFNFSLPYTMYTQFGKKLVLIGGYYYSSTNNVRVVATIENGSVSVTATQNNSTAVSVQKVYVFAR